MCPDHTDVHNECSGKDASLADAPPCFVANQLLNSTAPESCPLGRSAVAWTERNLGLHCESIEDMAAAQETILEYIEKLGFNCAAWALVEEQNRREAEQAAKEAAKLARAEEAAAAVSAASRSFVAACVAARAHTWRPALAGGRARRAA